MFQSETSPELDHRLTLSVSTRASRMDGMIPSLLGSPPLICCPSCRTVLMQWKQGRVQVVRVPMIVTSETLIDPVADPGITTCASLETWCCPRCSADFFVISFRGISAELSWHERDRYFYSLNHHFRAGGLFALILASHRPVWLTHAVDVLEGRLLTWLSPLQLSSAVQEPSFRNDSVRAVRTEAARHASRVWPEFLRQLHQGRLPLTAQEAGRLPGSP